MQELFAGLVVTEESITVHTVAGERGAQEGFDTSVALGAVVLQQCNGMQDNDVLIS